MRIIQQARSRALIRLLLAFGLILAGAIGTSRAGDEPIRVVYHIDDSARAIAAIRNINNHRRAAADAKIVVVALGAGIDFMLKGAKDTRGNPYEPMIDDLLSEGVEFRICNNTLSGRNIARDRVLADIGVVESGVAEIARLQFRERFAYIKP